MWSMPHWLFNFYLRQIPLSVYHNFIHFYRHFLTFITAQYINPPIIPYHYCWKWHHHNHVFNALGCQLLFAIHCLPYSPAAHDLGQFDRISTCRIARPSLDALPDPREPINSFFGTFEKTQLQIEHFLEHLAKWHCHKPKSISTFSFVQSKIGSYLSDLILLQCAQLQNRFSQSYFNFLLSRCGIKCSIW